MVFNKFYQDTHGYFFIECTTKNKTQKIPISKERVLKIMSILTEELNATPVYEIAPVMKEVCNG
jgi:hypothetical protein